MNEFFEDKLSNLDELTGIFRREVIISYMDMLISENKPFAMLILDIDNFKYINDGYGHLFGDNVLKEFARTLKKVIYDSGMGVVGRYGGDEFIGVLEGVTDYNDLWENLHTILSSPREIEDKTIKALEITVTIGSARFSKDATHMDALFELADKALYRGKMKGRNCFIIYLPEKHANINLKTERDKIVSSMYLHTKVFSGLSKTKDIKKGLKETINFLGNYFMIDHLCVCDDSGLYCEYFHPLCKKTSFVLISDKDIMSLMNTQIGVFYNNKIGEYVRFDNVSRQCVSDGIYSCFYAEIAVYGKHFGFVRADISENPRGRVWQNIDMDVLLNLAHTLALELYYQHKDISDLK